jgi:hypothetical protein
MRKRIERSVQSDGVGALSESAAWHEKAGCECPDNREASQ